MAPMLSPCPESTLTDRYQTTIPAPVRQAMGLEKQDKVHYHIEADGKVWLSRADQTESDPVLGEFLNFLARDIEHNPQHIQALSPDLVNRVQSLVKDVEFDLDSSLSDEDD
jgi:antitoxin PrlF